MTTQWNGWSLYWLIWLFFLFLVPELYCIAKGNGGTLSEQIWHLEGTGATFFRFFVAAFCLWLMLHMTFRWFTQ